MLIGLARVSTHDQSLDLQMDALRVAGCDRIFTEQVSASRDDRPGLRDALSHLRCGDTLVVHSLSRCSRNVRQLLSLLDDLQSSGIGFRSLTEAIDTSSPSGRMALHVFAAVSQLERDQLRARTMAGLAAARQRGRLGGRPRRMTEAKIAMARGLLADGKLTVAEVAEELGVATSTLYRAIPSARQHSLTYERAA